MPLPFPMRATVGAIREAALFVRDAWVAAAQGLPLGEQQRAAYIAGLLTPQSIVHPLNGDELAAQVVNVAPEAARIEEGTGSIHLPSVIRWAQSKAARRSKAGVYYLIIPFTHAAPRAGQAPRLGQLTWGMYRVARGLQRGEYLTAGRGGGQARPAPGMSPYRPRNPLNVRPGYTHAALQERLYRTSERRRGYSAYTTFRTMTEDSSGWHIPARAGAHLARQVERATASHVQALVEAAVREDIEAHIRQQGGG